MSYDAAMNKAWTELKKVVSEERLMVNLLSDTYDVDLRQKAVSSLSCNAPAKDFLKILILHYLAGRAKGSHAPAGEWISFKEIEGGEIYYPAFREGAITPILRKYGKAPERLVDAAERLGGRRIAGGDCAIEITAFDNIRVKVIIWKGDEEFGPDAAILFDKNITDIFTMEDIVVLSRLIAHSL